MKSILGVLSLIIGVFGNLVIFTKSAGEVLIKYNIDINFISILSVLSIFIGVYNLGRRNLMFLSIVNILLNIIFLFYLYY